MKPVYNVYLVIEKVVEERDVYTKIEEQHLFTFDNEQDARNYIEKIEREAA